MYTHIYICVYIYYIYIYKAVPTEVCPIVLVSGYFYISESRASVCADNRFYKSDSNFGENGSHCQYRVAKTYRMP